jgi:hypothetical protein
VFGTPTDVSVGVVFRDRGDRSDQVSAAPRSWSTSEERLASWRDTLTPSVGTAERAVRGSVGALAAAPDTSGRAPEQ